MDTVAPPSADRPNWWGRNWKWFVPTMVIVLVLSPAVCCGGMFVFVFGMIRQTEPYQLTMERVERDPEVLAALGQPIESGWLVSGNINYAGGGGEADLSFSIRGPQGRGTVYAVLERSAGQWQWGELVVNVDDTGERLVLESASSTP
ncbi:cytochrome c oxidase assembly factor Coa1 family protein [Phycisphaerales bacterium AB-hyl4]|uniref:Cytochrome c oxidase assembly factor Coa1 family protein n=1 Tax=Natronomicrosphaera hydrolytica TaxID=3242702 RepID=A0ABV4U2F6_9BACT